MSKIKAMKKLFKWRGKRVIVDENTKGVIGFGVNEKFLTGECVSSYSKLGEY